MMADQKASALIAACFVTLSMIMAYVSGHTLNAPLLLIMFFAVISALFAVLAVMPRATHNPSFHRQRNLLFWGDFADISVDEFVEQMQPLLRDNDAVYEAMLRDISCLGRVLMQRKYRFLTFAYRAFLIGLVAAPGTAFVQYVMG